MTTCRLRAAGAVATAISLLAVGAGCVGGAGQSTCGSVPQITASTDQLPTPVPASAVPTPTFPLGLDDDGVVNHDVILREALRFRGNDFLGPLQWVYDPEENGLSNVQVSGRVVAVSRDNGTGFYRASDGSLIYAYQGEDATYASVARRLVIWDTAAKQVGGYDESGRLEWCADLSFPNYDMPAPIAPPTLVTIPGNEHHVLAFYPTPKKAQVATINVSSGEVVWQREIPGRWSQIDSGSGHFVLSDEGNVRVFDWKSGKAQAKIPIPGNTATRISSGHIVVASKANAMLTAFDFAGSRQWTVSIKERFKRLKLTRAALLVQEENYGGPFGVYRLSDGKRIASFDTDGVVDDTASSSDVVYLATDPGILAIDVRSEQRKLIPVPTRGASTYVAGDRLIVRQQPSDSKVILAFQLPDG